MKEFSGRKRVPDKKLILLVVLLIGWSVVLLRYWESSGAPVSSARDQSGRTAKPVSASGEKEILAAWKLTEEMPAIHHPNRNIFGFGPPPSPAPQEESGAEESTEEPEPLPAAVCGNQACEEGEDYVNCPTDCPPPPPPPPPPITLRYIGYMSESGSSVAFLTDGKDIFIGRVNDIIANKYRIMKITAEIVELGYLNHDQTSTIRFQGQQGG